MKKKQKQIINKQQQKQSRDRLEAEFEVTGLSFSRADLEDYGLDTANVTDDKMRDIAGVLSELFGGKYLQEMAAEVAESRDIPKHPE
jgi:hypothetical protein